MIAAAWFVVLFAAVVGVAGMAVSILAMGSVIADVRRCGPSWRDSTRSESHE